MRPLFAALALVAGCHVVSGLDSFEPEARAGGGGAGGAAGTGGLEPSTGGSGGAATTDLVSRGVVARWFLAEPDGATTVADAVAPPLDLNVEPNASGFPALVGTAPHRGVMWEQEGSDGFVRAPIPGTKLETRLDGGNVATIEIVTSLVAVSDNETRLVYFGSNTDPGRLALRTVDIDTPVLFVNDVARREWPVDLSQPRLVLHLVVDATAPSEERARLYAQGELVAPSSTPAAIDQNLAMNLFDGDSPIEFHIGNRSQATMSEGRSPAGTIHYVALYDVALTEAEVGQNTEVLEKRDDP